MKATVIRSVRESDGAILKSMEISGLEAMNGDMQRKAAHMLMSLAIELMPKDWPDIETPQIILIKQG